MSDLTHDICWSCNGSGKQIDNPMKSGKHVYEDGYPPCDQCGGSGKIDYLKCSDCGAVVPAYCFSDHECDD